MKSRKCVSIECQCTLFLKFSNSRHLQTFMLQGVFKTIMHKITLTKVWYMHRSVVYTPYIHASSSDLFPSSKREYQHSNDEQTALFKHFVLNFSIVRVGVNQNHEPHITSVFLYRDKSTTASVRTCLIPHVQSVVYQRCRDGYEYISEYFRKHLSRRVFCEVFQSQKIAGQTQD
jgi:hypothetical protein